MRIPRMHPLRLSILLLPALVVSTVTGCSVVGWGRPDVPPILTLAASRVTRLDDTEVAATVVVTVTNPNAHPVRVGRIRYRLTFPGGGVSRGTVTASATVPADGQLDIELPVRIAIGELLPAAAPCLLMGELPYELDASASVGTPLVGSTIDLTTSSALRLDLPLELAQPRTRQRPPRFEFAAGGWQTQPCRLTVRRVRPRAIAAAGPKNPQRSSRPHGFHSRRDQRSAG